MQWHKTNFKGVRYRKHETRKHGVQNDKYFTVTYKLNGKTKSEGIGWASQGEKASDIYEALCELKRNQKRGFKPCTFAEKKKMAEVKRIAEENRDITLDQYWPKYLDFIKLKNKKTTWEKEESHYRLRLSPLLGSTLLRHIGTNEFEDLVRVLDNEGLSLRYKEYVTGTLRRILKRAKQNRVIDENPPSGKDIGVASPGASNRRLRIIQPDEAEAILAELDRMDKHAERVTRFAFLTGCRASEASTLKWQGVGPDSITFSETKNKDSRTLQFSKSLRQLFSELKEGPAEALVFLKADGTPYSQPPYSFRAVVKRLGLNEGYVPLNRISFHSIRHTVATKLAKQLNLKDLMEVMGWRTVQMAMRYVKGDEDTQRAALAGLEDTLRPKLTAKVVPIKQMNE